MLLVVEDDRPTRESLKELFSMFDFEHLLVSTIPDALDTFEKKSPKVLLTDYRLNGDTAEVLIKECRQRFPHCIIILMTASNPVSAKRFAEANEVDHLLLKPFSIDELIELLNKHL